MNELTSSSGPWGTTSYAYDGAGNMQNMTIGSTTTKYGYDSYNRMTSAGNATLTYNADGDLTQLVNGSTTWNYNYENELTSVLKNSARVETNLYSPSGEKSESIQGSNTIVYTYDQSQYNILYEKNLTSSQVIKNYYADGLQLGEAVGSSTYYMIDDALGNIRDVTTSTVSSVFSSDYMPYGKNYGLSQSLSALNFEYTHKPYDSVTGLYYYGGRFYDPSINRFITEDSMQYANMMNPLSLNMYVYVLNNPETMNDLTGHMYDILAVEDMAAGYNIPEDTVASDNLGISPGAAEKEAEAKESGSEYGGSYMTTEYIPGPSPRSPSKAGGTNPTAGQLGSFLVGVGYAVQIISKFIGFSE